MLRIDAHAHVFAKASARFPREVDADCPADREQPVEKLLAAMHAHRIRQAVLVQIGGAGLEQHAYLLHCLQQHRDRFLGIGLIPANDPDPERHMDRLAAEPGIIGFHLFSVGGPRDPFAPIAVEQFATYRIWEARRRERPCHLAVRPSRRCPPDPLPAGSLPPGARGPEPPRHLPRRREVVPRRERETAYRHARIQPRIPHHLPPQPLRKRRREPVRPARVQPRGLSLSRPHALAPKPVRRLRPRAPDVGHRFPLEPRGTPATRNSSEWSGSCCRICPRPITPPSWAPRPAASCASRRARRLVGLQSLTFG